MTSHPFRDTAIPRQSGWRRVAPDVAITVLVIITSAVSNTAANGHLRFPGDIDLISCAIGIVMAVALLFRRRWPLPILGGILVVWIAATVIGHSSLAEELAAAVAVFEIARRGRRLLAIVGAAVSVIVLVAVLLADPPLNLGLLLSGIAIIGFATAVGDAVHSRRALIDSITERAERAEQTREEEARRRVTEERLRIARELHDAAAHQIAVINLQAGAATASLAGDRREDTERALGAIRTSARNVLSEIAALLVVLRSDEDPADSNLPPLRGMSDLPELIATFEDSGLSVTGEHPPISEPLSGAIDVVAYKVIQEALTNAQKHGSTDTVELEVLIDSNSLHLVLRNATSPRPRTAMSTGYGLTGMRERVSSVHGRLTTIDAGGLYTLDVRLPLGQEGLS